MRKIISFSFTTLFLMIFSFIIINNNVNAKSYLSDKTEEVIDIDVSGAEDICQTDDGFIWIAQYSGLTRYDSKEFVTYNSFEENGITYDIINVRELIQRENTLYILTSKNIFKYYNHTFSNIDLGIDENLDLYCVEVNLVDGQLYIGSSDGLIIYDAESKTSVLVEETAGVKINDIEIDSSRNTYYYSISTGVYDKKNKCIIPSTTVLDIYTYDDYLLAGTTTGIISYNITSHTIDTTKFSMVTDQVNSMLYSVNDEKLFVGCEKDGVYCINPVTNSYSVADNLINKNQIVALLVDYENNLWIASHDVSASGVSMITKNALLNLLYDDEIWNGLEAGGKRVYAMERYDDTLYICCGASGVFFYDYNDEKILPSDGTDNIITTKLKEYFTTKGEDYKCDIRDVEFFNNKLYFVNYGYGLIEYDVTTKAVNFYDEDFISTDGNIKKITYAKDTSLASNKQILYMRCLRAFDDFLVIGYQSGGVIKFDGTSFSVYHIGKSVIYINKNDNGDVIFNHTQGIFKINDDFTSVELIETETGVTGNRLKFLVDGDKVYYNLNSRFFCSETVDGKTATREIVIPYIKGSIVEISKIKTTDNSGNEIYKYIIASQNQIYITDSLSDDNIDSNNKLINYEIYDSTNGLKPIQPNTSGYYDAEDNAYYFQTTDGIFVYDFSQALDNVVPLKIAINSIATDKNTFYGDSVKISKNSYRLSFNLSVLGFRPNKGYTVYYKLVGVDKDYVELAEDTTTISYTNLNGGKYEFNVYAVDEFGNQSNVVTINVVKAKKLFEYPLFWVIIIILAVILIALANVFFIRYRTRKAVERENEYKAITIESIEAIARTIDAKDTYTNGHSKRVGIYSREIAKALSLSEEDVENIYYIALLHDIGKIAIPMSILNKPGRLTDEEFEVMKSHTTAGAKILEGISTIPHIVEGAKYHHEKYGGGGYPEGLKGEEIPFIARIICCADCYDAMATKRVYKEPYTKEKIIDEFERCKNTQFDPHIADVVIKLIKEDRLRYGTEEKK